ncbi:hypothetical protein KCP75_11640 [Salmonella enterica subsp. enterica]|nr:hypothetical protein KCP75_11640 [Salmonella enterica subsp. enterica]
MVLTSIPAAWANNLAYNLHLPPEKSSSPAASFADRPAFRLRYGAREVGNLSHRLRPQTWSTNENTVISAKTLADPKRHFSSGKSGFTCGGAGSRAERRQAERLLQCVITICRPGRTSMKIGCRAGAIRVTLSLFRSLPDGERVAGPSR